MPVGFRCPTETSVVFRFYLSFPSPPPLWRPFLGLPAQAVKWHHHPDTRVFLAPLYWLSSHWFLSFWLLCQDLVKTLLNLTFPIYPLYGHQSVHLTVKAKWLLPWTCPGALWVKSRFPVCLRHNTVWTVFFSSFITSSTQPLQLASFISPLSLRAAFWVPLSLCGT
jgi:hypothetical protein